jgi:hypothetical protein
MRLVPEIRLPDLSRPKRYEHRRPSRPSHLPKRLTPPPPRREPPDLTVFLFAGAVLVIIVVIVAIPYVLVYVLDWLFG